MTRSSKGPRVRDVLYPEYIASMHDASHPITVAQAKDLLGWTEESENLPYKNDYLLKDRKGKKVRCLNNVTNRPLYMTIVETLIQEILRGMWQFNGEPIIVGRTGLILNGQHTLIALVLAGQEYDEHPGKWKDYWQQEPTIAKLIVFGVSEDDRVVNTMDTCKPRTLADVIYRSDYFKKVKGSDRRQIARAADHAIKLLWHRTGAKHDAYAPLRTHAESLDFISRHPRLLECVQHVHEENGDGKIATYIGVGYAAGLCYLMGSARTEREPDAESKERNDYDAQQFYSLATNPSEKQLDWGLWDKAQEFWVLLAGGDKQFAPLKQALGDALNNGGANNSVRSALLVKAWEVFSQDKKLRDEDLELEWTTDGEGVQHLAETPICGGIDLGNP